ncbi:hypothetical protein PHLGIDRAFT_120504 [Phlebiopsis gigantea 11061_1 CR5-6]|uniref:Uncharacterized protein n=1 Tax=Phlebiopsis gigantea (strain 11061_1 CR5-6) TaxID=745531 RepID=A0A0C3RUI3_PHLG1|nr:hypothetical protein PHLGIDRAFT_120504 [Phlebiopsis gigantea 11061_1 CR5-6]
MGGGTGSKPYKPVYVGLIKAGFLLLLMLPKDLLPAVVHMFSGTSCGRDISQEHLRFDILLDI